MKRANFPLGGTPTPPVAGESQTRLTTTTDRRSVPRPSVPEAHSTQAERDMRAAERRQKRDHDADEPRTGVVRRIDVPLARKPAAKPLAPPVLARPTLVERSRENGRQEPKARTEHPRSGRAVIDAAERARTRAKDEQDLRAWRCLEWGGPRDERRPARNPKVTIVQLSAAGDLVRHTGPDAWLPEAGDFMHKMAQLVAQGFGYDQCRSLCLKGTTAALAVSVVGEKQVMAVKGSVRALGNVLRKAGLE